MGTLQRLLAFLLTVLTLHVPASKAPAVPSKAGAPVLVCALAEANAWSDGTDTFTQYELKVQNGGEGVSHWILALEAPSGLRVSQSWNCTLSQNAGVLVLAPVDYNRAIPAGGEVQGIGLIVCGGKLSAVALTATLVNGDTVTVDCTAGSAVMQPPVPQQPALPQMPSKPAAVPAKAVGKLHVSGTGLADADGNAVQLRGASTHGLAWYPQYVSKETFQTLRDDWGANTVRLAMYTAEQGGYCSGGDRASLRATIDRGVQAATELGMYVVIDWHILSDGDPRTHQADAVAFFGEISAKYADCPNVLYEICNEPNGAPWDTAIRPYAQAVLAAIRRNAPDAVVIVGTNTWSQDVDAVVGKRLDDPNVIYALHFYAATHKDDLRRKLTQALDAGLPVFVSECGISEASGQGRVDMQSAEEWRKLLNERGVSFLAWGLSNKAETVSLLRPGCTKVSGWTEDDLTESGRWFRQAIRTR